MNYRGGNEREGAIQRERERINIPDFMQEAMRPPLSGRAPTRK